MNRKGYIFILLLCCSLGLWAQVPARTNMRGGGGGNLTPGNNFNPNNLRPQNNSQNTDSTQSSDATQGIIYDHVEEADSVLINAITLFSPTFGKSKVDSVSHPRLDPSGISCANPLDALNGDYFLNLGAIGQAQYSLYPVPYPSLSYRFQEDPNRALTALLGTPTMRQVQRPFTQLGFGSSLHQDYQLKITHTQNIKPRWNIGFDVDLLRRKGVYTRSGVRHTFFDLTTNYYSSDARYQLQAGILRNCLSQEENGGVADDETCWNTSNRSGVPVQLYGAENEWKTFSLFAHQSLNTVRQFEAVHPVHQTLFDTIPADSLGGNPTFKPRDTIVGYDTIAAATPHVLNTGVFGLDLRMDWQRHNFFDNSTGDGYFSNFYYSNLITLDSTRCWNGEADLFWTNDAFMDHKWKSPLILTVGIRPQIVSVRYTDSLTTAHYFSSTLHASGLLRLKKALELELRAEEVTGSYRNGDHLLSADLTLFKCFRLRLSSQAESPDNIYYFYLSNNYQWSVADYERIKRQQIALDYHLALPDSSTSFLRQLHIQAQASQIANAVWFDSEMMPHQGNATGTLVQGKIEGRLQHRWLHIDLQQMVQYSTDDQVARVPLFASKNSIYADLQVFWGALHLQTGFDLRYHTRYYADAWNPAVGSFYRQEEVQTGNYLWADFFASIQVKQASLYARVAHFNAPLEKEPHYFVLPHYPGEDLGVYFGVIWKFFN